MIKQLVALTSSAVFITSAFASQSPSFSTNLISLFPMANYNQTVSEWLKPSDPNYNKPLFDQSIQKKRMQMFDDHWLGDLSPWSEGFVKRLFATSMKQQELAVIAWLNNPKMQSYGENFRPHKQAWFDQIQANMNLDQFDPFQYNAANRAIAVHNMELRALPSDAKHFYSYKLAGQGFPFDNLQVSAVWAGTPLYIMGQTQDKVWDFVATPAVIGWVHSSDVARANATFINSWQQAGLNQLAAITKTKASIVDSKGRFLFSAYVGSVFPVSRSSGSQLQIMVPVADQDGQAQVKIATLNATQAAVMPLLPTEANMALLFKTMVGRPYGWGGSFFYNDCSQELKSIYAPFAIWLPRHSSDQLRGGVTVDKTSLPMDGRLSYLMGQGHPLMTVIYIGGHIIMYIGNYPNPHAAGSPPMAMTYQNLWGLAPASRNRRAVVGMSALFPMLKQYPEDKTLVSLAHARYFKVSYLDQLPTNLTAANQINVQHMLFPEAMLEQEQY